MKLCCLGIAILLFAILLQLCSSGLDTLTLILGLGGLCVCIAAVLRKQPSK